MRCSSGWTAQACRIFIGDGAAMMFDGVVGTSDKATEQALVEKTRELAGKAGRRLPP
jgi:hypothetical protein